MENSSHLVITPPSELCLGVWHTSAGHLSLYAEGWVFLHCYILEDIDFINWIIVDKITLEDVSYNP